jgi:hypothetical protein
MLSIDGCKLSVKSHFINSISNIQSDIASLVNMPGVSKYCIIYVPGGIQDNIITGVTKEFNVKLKGSF